MDSAEISFARPSSTSSDDVTVTIGAKGFNLVTRMTVFDDKEAVAKAAADAVTHAIAGSLRSIVLAGGTTPTRCYELLAERPINWGRVSVLFSDERCVPPDHEESNFKTANNSLLQAVSPATVYRMAGEIEPSVAAEEYNAIVNMVAPLNLVLLGIGPDGHTASLFPGSRILQSHRWVEAVFDSPKPPPQRITLTLRALRSALRVIILVTGTDKADALRQALKGEVPAGMIPNEEWLVDRNAASML